MPEIDLSPREYNEVGSTRPVFRRGWRKWLYFARHPILAFITYQQAYPDQDSSFKDRQFTALVYGLGTFLIRRLHSGIH